MDTFEDFCIIDEDEVRNIRDALENLDLTSAVGKIQDYFTQLDNVQLNIAVTGESGSGKSTFINAFRRLGHEEEDSAPTGPVETTTEATEYSHPNYPNVKLWDLPGIGTPRFKAEQYLVDVKFERYDFFIIVASDRFREYHVQLASEILKMKKNFYFLRNKIDTNIAAERESKPKTFNEEKTLEAIRQDCFKGLEKINVADPDVFLISCFKLGLYDFNRLHDAIEKELPKQKRYVFLIALPNITMEINKKKKTALQADIWKVALLSGIVATVPLPGLSVAVDVKVVLKKMKEYHTAFNLDDFSLQKLAEISHVSVQELKAEMKRTSHIKFNVTGVITQLVSFVMVAESSAEYVFSLIPILGSTAALGMSFATTRFMLNKCLDDMATDAHHVLMKAVSSPV